MRNVVIWTL